MCIFLPNSPDGGYLALSGSGSGGTGGGAVARWFFDADGVPGRRRSVLSESTGALASLPVGFQEPHCADMRQVPVALGVVDAVADDELVRNLESHQVGPDIRLPA